MKYSFYFMCLLLLILNASCASEKQADTPANKALEVIDKSISFADPLKKYDDLKSIEYTKMTKLYDEFGGLEDSIYQNHYYEFKPHLSGHIKWNKENENHAIYHKKGVTSKYTDQKHQGDSSATASAAYSMMASVYVMMMPFKLKDPGATLDFIDRQILAMIGPADIIQVNYDSDHNDNHTTNDTWWYYFDPDNAKFLGNKVDHGNGISLITNNKDQEVDGMRFHKYRKSYNVDSLGNVERLRAEYYYDNIKLIFD